MTIKAKSFESSDARRKRYTREQRDLQREIKSIEKSIKGFQEEIDDQPETQRKLEAYWGAKIEKAEARGDQDAKVEAKNQLEKALTDHGLASVELTRRAIRQFEEKKQPLEKRLDVIQRWLNKH